LVGAIAYDIVWKSRQGATNDRHQSLFDSFQKDLPIPEGLADRGVDQVVSLAGVAAQSSGFCRKSFAPDLCTMGDAER
jgi:hypothetical protein